MSEEQKLRERIQYLKEALSACQDDPREREALITRLLDTQDQLMFLTTAPTRVPRRLRAI